MKRRFFLHPAILTLSAIGAASPAYGDQPYIDHTAHVSTYSSPSIGFEFPLAVKTRDNPLSWPHQEIRGQNKIHYFSGAKQTVQALYHQLLTDLDITEEDVLIDCDGHQGACGFYTPREFIRHPSRHQLYTQHFDIFNLNRHHYRMLAAKQEDEENKTQYTLIIMRVHEDQNRAQLALDITTDSGSVAATDQDYTQTKKLNVDALRVGFEQGSAEVSPSELDTIDTMAAAIRGTAEVKYVLAGHTDSSGDDTLNEQLSRRRAEAVLELLTNRHDVAGERISIRAEGSRSPLASNDSDFGQALNRRVELIAVTPES